MESSDDSFVWTSASSDQDSDDSTEGKMAIETKTENNYTDESESGKLYKRKLHNQLFQNEEPKEKKVKKKKIKEEQDKKPDKKAQFKQESESESHDTDQNDEYLEMRVKQENNITPTELYHSDSKCSSTNKSKKSKSTLEESNCSIENNSRTVNILDKKKSKKNKSKHNKSDISDMNNEIETIIEDKFSAEETIVQSLPKKKDKTPKIKHSPGFENNSLNEQNATDTFQFINDNLPSDYSEDNIENKQNSRCNQTTDTNKSARNVRKLSDRIRFEDDSDIDQANHIQAVDEENQKFLFKRFLQVNPNLKKAHSSINSSCSISKDDDIYLLKCPQDIDVTLLQDMDMSIDNKSKFKLNGQTYDGLSGEDIKRITVLSSVNGKDLILNLPLKGLINFRKRIPKTHFMQDNYVVNNQTNFIPLPETKCRHPLFGSHYKKAVKLPSSIKARLNEVAMNATTKSHEKKKTKKHRSADKDELQMKMEAQEVTEKDIDQTTETETDKSNRKKRKRKFTDDDQPVPKKAKKVKHDPESSEAWESERVIEENLFNY